MSDAAVASTTAASASAPTTSVKKVKAAKPKGEKKEKTAPSHPVYGAMIKAAIKELGDRKGASKQAIFKFIVQKYKLGDNEKMINSRLRFALKKGVESGLLKQASGTGAAGRFRLGEKAEGHASKPKVVKKPKTEVKAKEAASKPKSPKVKKEKSSKSPKKAAKPKAKTAKSPKKTVTPKKAPSKPKTEKKSTKKTAASKA